MKIATESYLQCPQWRQIEKIENILNLNLTYDYGYYGC